LPGAVPVPFGLPVDFDLCGVMFMFNNLIDNKIFKVRTGYCLIGFPDSMEEKCPFEVSPLRECCVKFLDHNKVICRLVHLISGH
jgi:hypothetical protein